MFFNEQALAKSYFFRYELSLKIFCNGKRSSLLCQGANPINIFTAVIYGFSQ
jgi:hypothetical protein